MACLPLLNGAIIGFCKGIILFKNVKKIKILLDKLQRDWEYFDCEESELSIIKRYAEKAKQVTFLYSAMDLILPLNESRPRVLIFPGDFYVRTENNFFLIVTMEWYGVVCATHLLLTVDSLYMTLMLHSCGLFAVLNHRLENLKKNMKHKRLLPDNTVEDETTYLYLKNCIKLHSENIKYAERLNSVFNAAFFTDIAFGVFLASAAAFKFVISIGDSNQLIKYGSLYFVQSGRIFFYCFPGQLLLDHSISVNMAASRSKWYELSEKSKKLLMILMMRGVQPTGFVVAKVFTMNIELFSKVTRTCLSYCTIMLSIQDS
ncbi:odorant receptor Or2-like isoform X2 [Prorops nasuta]|uniref:odorant receptor Or2-like isoform X2 n=1 Tax=Prorops nasuta TaxID=863751 RepID=UPI0034CEFE3E